MPRTHANTVFFTRAVEECGGETIWRSTLSGYARVLTDHQKFRFANGRAEYGGMEKNIGHIPGESGRKCVRPAKKIAMGYPAQQAAVMDMQEWLRHACTLNAGLYL